MCFSLKSTIFEIYYVTICYSYDCKKSSSASLTKQEFDKKDNAHKDAYIGIPKQAGRQWTNLFSQLTKQFNENPEIVCSLPKFKELQTTITAFLSPFC